MIIYTIKWTEPFNPRLRVDNQITLGTFKDLAQHTVNFVYRKLRRGF